MQKKLSYYGHVYKMLMTSKIFQSDFGSLVYLFLGFNVFKENLTNMK